MNVDEIVCFAAAAAASVTAAAVRSVLIEMKFFTRAP